jgi:hypothetical protein
MGYISIGRVQFIRVNSSVREGVNWLSIQPEWETACYCVKQIILKRFCRRFPLRRHDTRSRQHAAPLAQFRVNA